MSEKQIDPEWAWSEWAPDDRHPWTVQKAAHLYRRAGFGGTPSELRSALEQSPVAVVDALLNAEVSPDYVAQSDQLVSAALATGNLKQLPAWWVYQMLTTPAQLLEKLTLFFHGHFATSAEKVADGRLMLTQNQVLRKGALGEFGDLVQEISRDPAMLIYLDSATNRKAHPNENYAREIMELFCLGEGRYSEHDIRELARCFTGWEIRREKFRFNSYQHDNGEKSFLGQSGKFGGEDAVRVVTSHEAVPEFIASKLVRFYVFDEPAASPELLSPLVEELRRTQLNTKAVLRKILTSNLFFSELAMARRIRSPIEFGVGILRSLEGSANSFELSADVENLGQGLFFPPSVKGWDGGRTWINSSTLLGRANMMKRLLSSPQTRFQEKSLSEYLAEAGIRTATAAVEFFEAQLFAVTLSPKVRQQLQSVFEGTLSDQTRLINAVHTMCTLPEIHLC